MLCGSWMANRSNECAHCHEFNRLKRLIQYVTHNSELSHTFHFAISIGSLRVLSKHAKNRAMCGDVRTENTYRVMANSHNIHSSTLTRPGQLWRHIIMYISVQTPFNSGVLYNHLPSPPPPDIARPLGSPRSSRDYNFIHSKRHQSIGCNIIVFTSVFNIFTQNAQQFNAYESCCVCGPQMVRAQERV